MLDFFFISCDLSDDSRFLSSSLCVNFMESCRVVITLKSVDEILR